MSTTATAEVIDEDIVKKVEDSRDVNDTDEMIDTLQETQESDVSEGGGDDHFAVAADEDNIDYSNSRGVYQKRYDGVPIDEIFAKKQVNDDHIQFNSIQISPNKGMTSPIEFTELGEIEGFIIAVSDKNMKIKCSYKDAYGKLSVLNSISPYEMAQLGRGLTIGETGNFPTPTGQLGRSVSGGANSTVFPYLLRYDDTIKENQSEDDAAGTVNDRYFVVVYEPRIPLRYSNFIIDVFNISSDTTKYIHYIEIKKRVYHELDTFETDKDINDVINAEPIPDQPTIYVKEEQDQKRKIVLDQAFNITPNTTEQPQQQVMFTSSSKPPPKKKRFIGWGV